MGKKGSLVQNYLKSIEAQKKIAFQPLNLQPSTCVPGGKAGFPINGILPNFPSDFQKLKY